MNEAWKEKTHRVIQRLSVKSYNQSNIKKNGKRYKKHRPYSIPEDAQELIECLATNNEEQAKYIFLTRKY